MDAITLLTHDHDRLKGLLKDLLDTPPQHSKKRATLSAQIKHELDVHAELEEDGFYPAFKSVGNGDQDDELYAEALEAHRVISNELVPELLATPVESGVFADRVSALKERVEQHIDIEEHGMFERAKQLMQKSQLDALARRLERRRNKLLRTTV